MKRWEPKNHLSVPRWLGVLGVIATVIPSISIGSTWVTPALAKCTSTPTYNGQARADDNSNYQDGWERVADGQGVYSSILNYSPWVEPNHHSGEQHVSSAWVMLDSNGGSSPGGYGQVGWWEFPGGTRQTFTQTVTPTGTFTGVFSAQTVGTYTGYEADYSYQYQGWMRYLINGSLIDQEPVNWYVQRGTVNGEINTLANQMPGGYNSNSNHEVFSNSQYNIAGTWQWFSGSADNSNSTYFGNDITNTQSYDMVWDKACAS